MAELAKDLVEVNENNIPVTTSLKVAEYFGKLHKNVIQKIESLECSIKFYRLNFKLVTYTDLKGESRKMYSLTRDGFTFLANKFTGKAAAEFTEKYIEVFNAMEAELTKGASLQGLPDFTNPVIAARAWADELEAKQIAEKTVEEMSPKAEAFDAYLTTENSMSFTEAAKALGFRSAYALTSRLREDGIIYKREGLNKNLPKAGYEAYFDAGRVVPKGQTKSYPQTRVRPEGLEWLRQRYTVEVI